MELLLTFSVFSMTRQVRELNSMMLHINNITGLEKLSLAPILPIHPKCILFKVSWFALIKLEISLRPLDPQYSHIKVNNIIPVCKYICIIPIVREG